MSPASGLDSDLSTLLVWLAKNRSIRHLSLGKNFNNIKSKWVQEAAVKQNLDLTSLPSLHSPSPLVFLLHRNVAPVLDSLVHMIQEEESVRETPSEELLFILFSLQLFLA